MQKQFNCMDTLKILKTKIHLNCKLKTVIVCIVFLFSSCINNNNSQKQNKENIPCPNPVLFMDFVSGMSKTQFDKTKTEYINEKQLDENGDYIFDAYSIKVPLKILPEFSESEKLNKLKLDFQIDNEDDYGEINAIIKAYIKKFGKPINFDELKDDYRTGLENHEFGEDILSEEIIIRAKKDIVWETSCKIIIIRNNSISGPEKVELNDLGLNESIDAIKNGNKGPFYKFKTSNVLIIIYQSLSDYNKDIEMQNELKEKQDSLDKAKEINVIEDI